MTQDSDPDETLSFPGSLTGSVSGSCGSLTHGADHWRGTTISGTTARARVCRYARSALVCRKRA